MELDWNRDPPTFCRNVFLGYANFSQFLKCVLPPLHVMKFIFILLYQAENPF